MTSPSAKAAQQIQRYDCETLGTYDHYGDMVPDEYGDWVKHEDHLAVLRARDAEIEGLVQKWREEAKECEEVTRLFQGKWVLLRRCADEISALITKEQQK